MPLWKNVKKWLLPQQVKPLRVIYSKIYGVTYKNIDRQNRQALIRSYAGKGRDLYLVHEPENKYSPNAISIWIDGDGTRHQLGWISEEINGAIVQSLQDDHLRVTAKIEAVTGGDDLNYGVNVKIEIYDNHPPSDTPVGK